MVSWIKVIRIIFVSWLWSRFRPQGWRSTVVAVILLHWSSRYSCWMKLQLLRAWHVQWYFPVFAVGILWRIGSSNFLVRNAPVVEGCWFHTDHVWHNRAFALIWTHWRIQTSFSRIHLCKLFSALKNAADWHVLILTFFKAKSVPEDVHGFSFACHICKLFFFECNLSFEFLVTMFNAECLFVGGWSHIMSVWTIFGFLVEGVKGTWSILSFTIALVHLFEVTVWISTHGLCRPHEWTRTFSLLS